MQLRHRRHQQDRVRRPQQHGREDQRPREVHEDDLEVHEGDRVGHRMHIMVSKSLTISTTILTPYHVNNNSFQVPEQQGNHLDPVAERSHPLLVGHQDLQPQGFQRQIKLPNVTELNVIPSI